MITTTVKIDWSEDIEEKAMAAVEKAQVVLDEQIIKDSNYYAPHDTGALIDSALIASLIGQGQLHWDTPYARKVYYGIDINFHKDQNPNARALWFEAAKANWLVDWVNLANKEVKKNL